MMEDDLELLLKYPLVSSEICEGRKHYTGRVLCENRDIELHIIQEPNDENAKYKILSDLGDGFNVANITSTNVIDLLRDICNKLENNIQTLPQNRTSVYQKILQEYSELTNFYLSIKRCQISPDLSKITLLILDEAGREHCLEISVDLNETKGVYRAVNLNLPSECTKELATNFLFVTEVYSKFIEVVEMLQPFFNAMDDLDRSCCILDPEEPSRRYCHRRIWLGELEHCVHTFYFGLFKVDHNLSVVVILNPLNLEVRPIIKFLGPQSIVEERHEKICEKLNSWNKNTDLIHGLLNILDLEEFPVQPKQKKMMLKDAGECSICFSSRLNDKLPEIVCDNKSCENFYHIECLHEWLTSINSKRIFNQLHGQCPNCEKKIICPLLDTEMS